ncbi:uncharacterized protein LOC124910322 [Impatiens glandulifera]|uniref:uncharacterized protein LOC124910322 n=1 Tax=Impatiens glandulifera TaxID=253017 RepID=UPI001FB19D47|nr:uncharacterized protein LOC124910322 [Impatiens glandulifera]
MLDSKTEQADGFFFGRKTIPGEPTGIFSPPLWKKTTLSQTHMQPQSHRSNNLRSQNPTARSQAIARGQWELMEMVKNMPESCYELSLKDLVENPRVKEQECLVPEKIQGKKIGKKVKLVSIGNIDNCKNGGLFLKLVFPISFGGSKKRKKKKTNSKSSPEPENWEKSSKDGGGLEREWWWKKRFSASGESESDGSRSSHTGNRSRNMEGLIPRCWSFFFPKKG